MDQTQLDYAGIISLAGTVALALVTLIESVRPGLSATLHNTILRAVTFALTLAGVLYYNWSQNTLDLQHQALLYIAIAAGLPAFHIALKNVPSSAVTGAVQQALAGMSDTKTTPAETPTPPQQQ